MAKKTSVVKKKLHSKLKAVKPVEQPTKIDGMKAFDHAAETMQGNPILASFRFILSKDVDAANSGMLQALRRMADNYSWESEAKFILDVGKIHIEPIGGEFMEAFNTVLKGKKHAGTIGYRRKCARAYELWIENLRLMTAREADAKAHLVGKLSPKAQERIEGLRRIFYVDTVANNLIFDRGQMLLQAMPGEPGYAFAAHVNAFQHAIEFERDKRIGEAEKFRGDRDQQVHSVQCEAMFDATMRLICGRDPAIAEAYRKMKPDGPASKTKKASDEKLKSGLLLVHSRD